MVIEMMTEKQTRGTWVGRMLSKLAKENLVRCFAHFSWPVTLFSSVGVHLTEINKSIVPQVPVTLLESLELKRSISAFFKDRAIKEKLNKAPSIPFNPISSVEQSLNNSVFYQTEVFYRTPGAKQESLALALKCLQLCVEKSLGWERAQKLKDPWSPELYEEGKQLKFWKRKCSWCQEPETRQVRAPGQDLLQSLC